jgi:hypothetical protein
MDLNYLYLRHQVSLFRARQASCARSRAAHCTLAQGYADRILDIRRANIAAAA